MDPTSVAPKISSTGTRQNCSARAAMSASNGAVAEITACNGGKGVCAASNAPRCSGVVMKTGAGAMVQDLVSSASAAKCAASARLAAASAGKKDVSHHVMVEACSGSSAIVSSP